MPTQSNQPRKGFYGGPRTTPRSSKVVKQARELITLYFRDIEPTNLSLKNDVNFQDLADCINVYYTPKDKKDEKDYIKPRFLNEIFNNVGPMRKSKERVDFVYRILNSIVERREDIKNVNLGKITTLEDWHPHTKRSDTGRSSDYFVLPLNGEVFKRITCTVFSNSLYYRFGIKFIGGAIFERDNIQTRDENVLVHTGVGTMTARYNDDLFTALYLDGNRIEINGIRSRDKLTNIRPVRGKGYDIEVFIDDVDDCINFNINGKTFERVFASRKILNKVYLFSWADNQEYELLVKNIKIETRHI